MDKKDKTKIEVMKILEENKITNFASPEQQLNKVVSEETSTTESEKDRSSEEIIKEIKSVLEKQVKPNVAMHGGIINFLSYDTGIVKLEMAGACSGCAMSKKTLHEGVERMLKHYVPEVNQLIGEDDEQAAEKGYTPWATL